MAKGDPVPIACCGPEAQQAPPRRRGAMRYFFDDYVLDTQRYELHCAGTRIHLRPKVFQILAYLLAHRDRVVPKAELLGHVWPNQFIGDATLNSCIKAVRQALGRGDGHRASYTPCTARAIAFVAAVVVQEHLSVDAAATLPLHGVEGVTHQNALALLPWPHRSLTRRASPWRRRTGNTNRSPCCVGPWPRSPRWPRLGPEAMYHLMREVLALVQDTVQHYEGILLRFLVRALWRYSEHRWHRRTMPVGLCWQPR